jgi:hypothetical protein
VFTLPFTEVEGGVLELGPPKFRFHRINASAAEIDAYEKRRSNEKEAALKLAEWESKWLNPAGEFKGQIITGDAYSAATEADVIAWDYSETAAGREAKSEAKGLFESVHAEMVKSGVYPASK